MEVWKDIPGYEGLYQVSNLGRVKSLDRVVQKGETTRRFHGKIIAASNKKNGYLQIKLYKNGVRQFYGVHRLVAECFVLNPDGKPQVNHIDGDKRNNRADNLEWCTASENQLHAVSHGLHGAKLERNNERSIPVYQYDKDMKLIAEYPSEGEAERQTGVWQGNIAQAAKHGWKAGGFYWKKAQ